MRILDRYLLRELLIPFGYCLGGFWIFWMAFDLFTELGDFQKDGLSIAGVTQYYLLKTPEMMVLVLPVAFLLALLYALTDMARHQELTAMRAAGLSLLRIALPYLSVGFLLSLIVFGVNELWVPQTAPSAEGLLHPDKQASAKKTKQWETKLGFSNTRQKRKWYMDAYNVVTTEMVRPHVQWMLATGTRWEIVAERGIYFDGAWVFTNVIERVYTPGEWQPMITETNWFVASFSETPDHIQSVININRISSFKDAKKTQLSIGEILNYKSLYNDDSPKLAMLDTKLHGRLAAPWTCLVVALIALPFGAASGRRNAYVGVASSILICFAFFVLSQLALALGTGGYTPPWVAAWAPNFVFGCVGLMMTWRVR